MNPNVTIKTSFQTLSIAITLLATLLKPGVASAQMIANGSFESGALAAPGINIFAPNNITITGWLIGGSSIDYIGSAWQAGEGQRCIDLSGISAGSLSQTIFSLQPGQTYRVSFLLSGNSDITSFPGQNTDPIKSLVLGVGATSQQFSFDATSYSQMNMGWVPRQMDFVANAPSMTLTVTSLEFSAYGPAVDNSSIVAVPEPSSLGLLILGGAALIQGRFRKTA
jgi:choice-of-anchor C domain-containing protein